MKRRHVIACGVLCALLAIGTGWLGCALPNKWVFGAMIQFTVFCIGAMVCAFIASEMDS